MKRDFLIKRKSLRNITLKFHQRKAFFAANILLCMVAKTFNHQQDQNSGLLRALVVAKVVAFRTKSSNLNYELGLFFYVTLSLRYCLM